jgi:quinol monooxygenase YgiN
VKFSPIISFIQESSWHGGNVTLSILELTPILGKREEILELLRFCVDELRTKPGCLGSAVYEGGDQSETILYLERWRSAEELHRHIQSNLYLGVLVAMDLASGPPDLNFYELSETKSMELIAALRSSDVV